MPKYSYTEIDNVNSPSAASTINANFQELQDLIDTLLSRDGLIPNTVNADIDMNGFDLLNYAGGIPGPPGPPGTGGGSTYDLTFDGVTDQAVDLQTVLDDAGARVATLGPQTVVLVSDDVALRIDARVLVPSDVTLDLSQTPVTLGKYGEIAIGGSLEESPSSDLIRLASDAAAGASTIYLNSVNGSNATLLGANGTVSYVIIRGMSDANTRAIQRHEGLLTIVDNADTANIECTIDPPLPDDEGLWEVEYAAGDYEAATGTVDRTLITVVTSATLASNVAENDQVITLSDATDFQSGALAVLYDDRLASSVDGVSQNSIRTEVIKVRRQPSANELVYPEVPITKDFLTANSARLLKITPVENAHIIGLRCFGIAEAPDDPGSRIHYAQGSYCLDCTIRDVQIDESEATYAHRGQAARFQKSYNSHIIGGFRKCKPSEEAASGDWYGSSLYYCNQSTILGFRSWYARHGVLAQGSVNGAFAKCRAISPQINGWDLHGLDERNWHVIECGNEGPEWGADGSSQRSGGTIGNTFHAGGAKNVTVQGGAIRGFQAGDNSSGIGVIIRPNTSNIQILDSVRITDCDRGVQVNVQDEWPTLGFSAIDIQANMDDCYIGVGIDGRVQAWDVADTYSGTTERPIHVENSGNVYATSTTTVGGSAPVHGSGTVGDWVYISAAQRVASDIKVSGIARGATRPIVFTRVDDLVINNIAIAAAQGLELDDCLAFRFRDSHIRIDGDGDYIINGGGNTGAYVINVDAGSSAIDDDTGITVLSEGSTPVVISDDETLADESSTDVVSERAIKEYVDGVTSSPVTITRISPAAATTDVVLDNSNARVGVTAQAITVERMVRIDASSGAVAITVDWNNADLDMEWGLIIEDATNAITFEQADVNFDSSGETTSSSATILMEDTTFIEEDMAVTGDGIPAGAFVASITTNTSITIDDGAGTPVLATATAEVVTLTFAAGLRGEINARTDTIEMRPGLAFVKVVAKALGVDVLVEGATKEGVGPFEVEQEVADFTLTYAHVGKLVWLTKATGTQTVTLPKPSVIDALAGQVIQLQAGDNGATAFDISTTGSPTIVKPTLNGLTLAVGSIGALTALDDDTWSLQGTELT